MIKSFIKVLILLLILFLLIIGYLSYFGITTTKFNSIIKNQIKNQNSDLDIDLKKVKLHLDLKNISIKIKTKNPKIILNNSINIELDEISSNILISSYFQSKFALKNLSIISKNNKINNYINFYKYFDNSIQIILLNQFFKRGIAQISIDLNFDESGKIKNNFNLKGKILNAEIRTFKNKNIKDLSLNFSVKNKNYILEKILFKFNEVNFTSELLSIQEKKDKFFVKGNLKNKKNKISSDLILLIFNNNPDIFDFSNTKFDSTSEFSFNLSKKFKITNLKFDSKLNLDKLILKYNKYKIKNYIKNYNKLINLKESKFHIRYSENIISINGSSDFYIEENFKNSMKFQIKQNKNKLIFDTF
ncbi:hypothetical protein OAJ40_01085, partial [Candidatus Pelagibacter sp.]|nr:hypothetical protein [Candidatus Pelagibacter sp.]